MGRVCTRERKGAIGQKQNNGTKRTEDRTRRNNARDRSGPSTCRKARKVDRGSSVLGLLTESDAIIFFWPKLTITEQQVVCMCVVVVGYGESGHLLQTTPPPPLSLSLPQVLITVTPPTFFLSLSIPIFFFTVTPLLSVCLCLSLSAFQLMTVTRL